MKSYFVCLWLLISTCCFSQKKKNPLRKIYTNENKLTYLSEDNFTNSETVLDAILKIPNIFIDNENRINFKNQPIDIWIDEKNQNIPNSNLIELLRIIPIGIIYSIEIINNPNVFYNTETDFLLNIKTENLLSSHNLNLLSLSVIKDKDLKLNSFMNFKRAYKDLFFQINTAFSVGNNIDKKENITLFSNELNDFTNYHNTFTSKNRFFIETSMFYDINFRDKVGFNFKHYSNGSDNLFKNTELSTNSFNNYQSNEFNDLEIYYLQKLDKGGTKFKMTGNLTSFEKRLGSGSFNKYFQSNILTYDLSKIGYLLYKKELFKADLIIPTTYLPFTLNTGFEYFKNTNSLNVNTNNSKVNSIIQQKNIYVLIGKELNKFNFKIGLKIAKNKSEIDSIDSIKNTYEFLPSIETRYNVDKKNTINLSYSRKINQTNTLILNNLLIINDFNSIDSDALFSISDNIFANLSYFNYDYLTLSFSRPNYVFIPFYDYEVNKMSYKTIINPHFYNVSLSLPISKNLLKLAVKDYLQDFKEYSLSLNIGSNFLSHNKKIFSNYFLSINGKVNILYDTNLLFSSSLISKNNWHLKATTKNLYKLDFSLNKNFLSNKLKTSIAVNDLFNTFKQTTISNIDNEILNISDSYSLQKFTISAVYNFNTILNPKKYKKL